MTKNSKHLGRLAGVAGTALLGVLFFFVIIGVFGLRSAIVGLLIFVLSTIGLCHQFPVEGRQL